MGAGMMQIATSMDSATSGDSLLNAQWARVRSRLRYEYGEAIFRSWLQPLALAGKSNTDLHLSVPSRFMRDWIMTHYLDRLRHLWGQENPDIVSIHILVDASREGFEKENAEVEIPSPFPLKSQEEPTRAWGRIEEVSAPLDPRLTFENFVVGKSNELAHAAALKVAEAGHVPFNPLFLYGGVGLGKTHLMHAVAWHIRRKHPEKKVIYLSAEKFMYQFIRALRDKSTVAFKELFRSVDVLMVDDVQFIIGKESTQEEFFHTFNALADQNHQIILSADKSPSDLEGLEERMRSRLGWGLVADIHPTTYELRMGILQNKAEQSGIEIPVKVLEFLAHRVASNIRELEGALTRLIAHATLVGRPVTLESTQELLRDLLRASDRRMTVEEIQRRVAEHFNIKLSDMQSPRRARQVARPRQIAMYLAKQLTTLSLPDIGRKFGGRDHTTVMHAVKKVEELCATSSALAEDVDLLRHRLQA